MQLQFAPEMRTVVMFALIAEAERHVAAALFAKIVNDKPVQDQHDFVVEQLWQLVDQIAPVVDSPASNLGDGRL